MVQIAKLVALAPLMPIIVGIGGNSGNQKTITLIVCALALGQITVRQRPQAVCQRARRMFSQWSDLGQRGWCFCVFDLPQPAAESRHDQRQWCSNCCWRWLRVAVPLLMHKLGRDPAVGSSVMITAVTDSGGFFIFLGLAALV
jgi:magnesium transporter